MSIQSIYRTYNRYRTLQTHKISSLPIVILMPHSACNCRCVMCDIWKGNHNLQQLTEKDITGLLHTLKKYGTQQVLMSGGEAMLNPNFFRFCEILKSEGIKITLLSTGLTIGKHAERLVECVDDLIVSLDGDEMLHDAIRNIHGAFNKLKSGIATIRSIAPGYLINGRTVIHKLNFVNWDRIIDAAKEIGLNSISFLPADTSSAAFNRETPWNADRQYEIMLAKEDLPALRCIIDDLFQNYSREFENHFIVESKAKIEKLYSYYAAQHGLNDFPYKKCNAPWVSTVIEADGTVRPCFFHKGYGNIKTKSLESIINSPEAIDFRKGLDMQMNETCIKCVCYLNLSPTTNIS